MKCKNCELQLKVEDNYCNNCGAKVITKRITFKTLWEEFSDRVLNLESNLFKTFKHLFTQPEVVIDGYINGTRKKYITAFGYFVISITLGGLYTFVFGEFFIDDFLNGADNGTGPNDMDMVKSIMDFTGKYQSMLNFLNIPLLAVVHRLVFFNYRKYNFIEIAVIYLYTFSHFNIILYLVSLAFLWSSTATLIISVLSSILLVFYVAYALMRLYDLSVQNIIIKTLLFLLIGGIFMFLITIAISVILYKTGVFDTMIEAAKQAAEAQKNKS
ncbi:DUF3667 domain-containing protein [Sungkyunkwania multivorans]|uniref:DUF3667 domain-containing protein n=1 Tax=Sungkyunkwania multivorans TaxID=1173618 RepID=A0ABW3CYZ1_9FLAO